MTALDSDDGIDEARWGRILGGRRAKRCNVCSRSIWECPRESGHDCLTAAKESPMSGLISRTITAERNDQALARAVCALVQHLAIAFSPCSAASHVAAMSRRPAKLEYRGIDGDDVLLDCSRCGERIRLSRSLALRASAPIGLVRRRSPDDVATKEIPAITMAEAAADAHARLGGAR